MTMNVHMVGSGVRVELVAWAEAAEELRELRSAVFVSEQRVAPELEDDGLDPECLHAVVRDDAGRVVATGRLMPDGRIGRMAVRRELRGRGIGASVLRALLAGARERGLREVFLHAQAHAQAFYARFGFTLEGAPFEEAGIRHVGMRAVL